jgi:hypothetical protein
MVKSVDLPCFNGKLAQAELKELPKTAERRKRSGLCDRDGLLYRKTFQRQMRFRRLTCRANHLHIFIIARIDARAGKLVAGFLNRRDGRIDGARRLTTRRVSSAAGDPSACDRGPKFSSDKMRYRITLRHHKQLAAERAD